MGMHTPRNEGVNSPHGDVQSSQGGVTISKRECHISKRECHNVQMSMYKNQRRIWGLVHFWDRDLVHNPAQFRFKFWPNSGSRLGRIVVHILSFSLENVRKTHSGGGSRIGGIWVHELVLIWFPFRLDLRSLLNRF